MESERRLVRVTKVYGVPSLVFAEGIIVGISSANGLPIIVIAFQRDQLKRGINHQQSNKMRSLTHSFHQEISATHMPSQSLIP